MKYITYRQFNGRAICGEINIPVYTECYMSGGVIFYKDKPVCVATSENAHAYFMRNDDGKGMLRGDYITLIKSVLKKFPSKWPKIWGDRICRKYKRPEHYDHWIWNHDFYNADITELEYIYSLLNQQ